MPNPAPFPSMTYERRTGCGDLYITLGEEEVLSCADCVGKVLKEYLASKTEEEKK